MRVRKKLRKRVRERFRITEVLQRFEPGQKVRIHLEPASQKGRPYPRFQGMTGEIVGKRGRAYLVEIFDKNKRKLIISRPEHLKPV